MIPPGHYIRARNGERIEDLATKFATTVGDIRVLNRGNPDLAGCGDGDRLRHDAMVIIPWTWASCDIEFKHSVVHYVKPGDTCAAVAERFGISREQLLYLNPV